MSTSGGRTSQRAWVLRTNSIAEETPRGRTFPTASEAGPNTTSRGTFPLEETLATCRLMRTPRWRHIAIPSMVVIPRRSRNTSIAGIFWPGWRFDFKKKHRQAREGRENNCRAFAKLAPRSLRRWRLLRSLRWRRSRKFGVVHGNILVKLFHLNGELVSRPGKCPAKRNFQAIGIAIIRIINLRGVAAQRRLDRK